MSKKDQLINKEKIANTYLDELKDQLSVLKNKTKESILSPKHIDWIRKKLLGKKMGFFDRIKGRFSMRWLNISAIDTFKIGGKTYDSIIDFIQETHEKIEEAKTEAELNVLALEIQNNQTEINEIVSTTAGDAIVNTAKLAIGTGQYVTGKHCRDRVVNKVFALAGFSKNKIKIVFTGKPYGNKINGETLNKNTDYYQNKENYLKLLDEIQKGDHLIFHNGNSSDEYGDHSGIFIERDEEKGGNPYAKIASLPKSNGKPNIKTYDLSQQKKTSYGTPKGQVRVIRRANGIPYTKKQIAENINN